MLNHEGYVGRQVDQFRIDQFVARGAMGMVFKAFDTVLIRTVALKLIPKTPKESLSPHESATLEEARKRLVQEAKTAGRLSHPNIVTIHSYGETDEFEYICMEFVQGKTLAEILSAQKVLSAEEAVTIFEQILLAIEVANKEQIVHRDIKPSNIMMTDDGLVKVMDFGIAKLPSLSMTVTGTVLGTPFYMSPEQISGQRIDIRSDLFSLGAVLYESLTGERPFAGENTATLAYKIVQTDPIPPKILNVHIPQGLGKVISKALAKDPSERYQTPKEMLIALRAAVRGREEPQEEATIIAKSSEAETLVVSRDAVEELIAKEVSLAEEAKSRLVEKEVEKSAETGPAATQAEVRPAVKSAQAEPDAAVKKEAAEAAEAAPVKAKPAAPKAGQPEKKPLDDRKKSPQPVMVIAAAVVAIVAVIVFMKMFGGPGQPPPQVPADTRPPSQQAPVSTDQSKSTAKLPSKQAPATNDQAKSTAESLTAQARNAISRNPAEALKLLQEAVTVDPGNFEASTQLAKLLAQRRDYAGAIQQYQKALTINNQSAEIYFNLGQLYLNQGDVDNSIANYEKCWSLAPSFQDEVLANLGIAYLKKNNVSQAQSLFRQALEINPNNSVARAQLASAQSSSPGQQDATMTPDVARPQDTAKPQDLSRPLEATIDIPQTQGSASSVGTASSSIAALLTQAKAAKDTNPAESERLFKEVLAIDPGNFEALTQVGRFFTMKKDYPQAIQHYQRALQINDQAADVHFNLGFIYLAQGAYDSAKASYENCLALSPQYKDEVLTNLGIVEIKKKNYDRARQLLREALDLNANNSIAKNQLSNLNKMQK